MRDHGCASLDPLVGQNDDRKKESAGKRILIRQNQNREYRERGCRHFAQVKEGCQTLNREVIIGN